MSNFIFHDISYAQGVYNMAADPNPVIAMKMTGTYYGSKVNYPDAQAGNNYKNAIRYNKIPILYHFAGGGDPIAEADYFVNVGAMPLADGDIYALDYELTASMNPPADPNNWCLQFCERVHARTGTWPLFYTYTAMQKQYGFAGVLQNSGFWQANYGVSPDADIPGSPPYIIQQYQGSPLDTNTSFIPLETLKKYGHGYTAPATTPPPAPTPTPPPTPAPVPVTPTPPPVEVPPISQPEPTPPNQQGGSPAPEPGPAPGIITSPDTPAQGWISKLIAWLKSFFGIH